MTIREKIRTHHIPQMPTDIHNRAARRPLLRRLVQRADSPRVHERVGRETAARVEKRRGVAGCGVEGCDGDDEAGDGEHVVGHDVEAAFFLAVRGPGDEEGDDGAEDVGGCGEDEGHGAGAQIKASDHRWEEVVESVAGGHEDVHEDLVGNGG